MEIIIFIIGLVVGSNTNEPVPLDLEHVTYVEQNAYGEYWKPITPEIPKCTLR